MGVSKNKATHKAYKKKKALQKQHIKHKAKMMEKNLTEVPQTFIYHKDKNTVEVPLKEWQVLNQAANRLQDIAMFVSTMESIGRLHIDNGTLLPVFASDLEDSGVKNPDGSEQKKLKDAFWNKGKQEKPTIVKADGVTIYDSNEEVD